MKEAFKRCIRLTDYKEASYVFLEAKRDIRTHHANCVRQ